MEQQLPRLPLQVSQRHRQITSLVKSATSSSRENTSSANMSILIVVTLDALIRLVIGGSTGLETFDVTCLPATAPKKRKINTFANSEIANMPLKDFPGTIIAYDTFGYSTMEDRAAARAAFWNFNRKTSDSDFYMTVYPVLAALARLSFRERSQPRKRFPKVSNDAFGPCPYCRIRASNKGPTTFRTSLRLRHETNGGHRG